MSAALAEAKKKKELVSLAPSACQAEARWKDFHTINLRDMGQIRVQWRTFCAHGAACACLLKQCAA
jgi:hypothetical protein